MLTQEEVTHYHATGQVTPAFRLDGEVVASIRHKMEALFEARPDLDPDYAPSLIEIDQTWLEFAAHAGIVDCVAQLMGDDIIVWGSSFFAKKGTGSKATPWHQDGQYWPMQPLAACTVWIAIDPSTVENGCLRVIPGSHKKRKIFDHDIGSLDTAVLNQCISAHDMPEAAPIDVELEPGMISIHDAFTVHGAEPNNSGTRRAGLTYRYMPTTSHYDRELAAELGVKQGGLPLEKRQLHLVRGIDRCGRNDVYTGPVAAA